MGWRSETEHSAVRLVGVAPPPHVGDLGVSDGASQVWLYLVNSGNLTASADVTILTDTGQQSGLNSAISIAPKQYVAENVTPYVQGSQAIARAMQMRCR